MMIFEIILLPILFIIIVNDFLYYKIENKHLVCILSIIACICILNFDKVQYMPFLFSITTIFIGIILSKKNIIGGGDIKLISILYLLFFEIESAKFFVNFLLQTSIFGLIFSISFVLFQKYINTFKPFLHSKIKNSSFFKTLLLLKNNDRIRISPYVIPYGVPIVLSFAMTYYSHKW